MDFVRGSATFGLLGLALAYGQAHEVSDAQQQYVQRRLAAPPPIVNVQTPRGGPDVEGPKGILFGSFGYSAAWSFGAALYVPRLVLRSKTSQRPIGIFLGDPGGWVFNKTIHTEIPRSRDTAGLMSFSLFKVELPAGDYELIDVGSSRIATGPYPPPSLTSAKFPPIPVRVEAGQAAYLGRLAVIPQTEEVPPNTARHPREMEGTDMRPTYRMRGVFVWAQNAVDVDSRMAQIPDGWSIRSLDGLLRDTAPEVFRDEVREEDLDHKGRSIH